MSQSIAIFSLRRLWGKDKVSYSVRLLIAQLGVVVPCWYWQRMEIVIPLMLGVIASALAETDDHWRGRIRALLATLCCFSIAAFSVELLFPNPWLFACGLALSTFGFIMLGALGSRYGSIAFASLLLAIYTMQSLAMGSLTVRQPLLLLAGATWYGMLSVLWCALWPNQPVQQALARVFHELETYLNLKASLFEPVADLSPHRLRLDLARQNSRLVAALDEAKETLLSRVRNSRPGQTDPYLKLYFLAQDIHERASSSHYHYSELSEAFHYSDVLFRLQRLLRLQGRTCGSLGEAIARRQPFHYGNSSVLALDELQDSLNHLEQMPQPQWRPLLPSLRYLLRNLATIERQLANAADPDTLEQAKDATLADGQARTLKEMTQRLRAQFTPASSLFRHALRLAIALTCGYGLLQLLDLPLGYWVLLTTVFICQSSYSATRRRLTQRILGTLGGLLLGSVLLYVIPGEEAQLLLIVLSGVGFFVLRASHYGVATAMITLLVLLSFQQTGHGLAMIWPRLLDTLLGGALAVLAVLLILPEWQGRRLPQNMARALAASSDYLTQVMRQYRQGKQDDLAYRVARRNAHNADAELSQVLHAMLQEPDRHRHSPQTSFRFLCLNHALLGYISALGAHRQPLPGDDSNQDLLRRAQEAIQNQLAAIVTQLQQRSCELPARPDKELLEQLQNWPDIMDDSVRLVKQQLYLIYRMLTELHQLAARLVCSTTALQPDQEVQPATTDRK